VNNPLLAVNGKVHIHRNGRSQVRVQDVTFIRFDLKRKLVEDGGQEFVFPQQQRGLFQGSTNLHRMLKRLLKSGSTVLSPRRRRNE
jgi:hypothetical protein